MRQGDGRRKAAAHPAPTAAAIEGPKGEGAEDEGAEDEGARPEERAAAPRLYSRAPTTFIRPKPARGKTYLGYLRVGEHVALRSEEKVPGPGCKKGFYAIEPRGYVCDDPTVTREPTPRMLEDATAPRPGPLPYSYALSNGAPMYLRLPSPAEAEKAERFLGPARRGVRLPKYWASHEELAEDRLALPEGSVPSPLYTEAPAKRPLRRVIPLGSMLAYTRAFEAEGRIWLLSADGTLVPADRVRPFRPSEFEGVWLGDENSLPIAFFKKGETARYVKDASGKLVPSGKTFPLRGRGKLTGAEVEQDGERFLEAELPGGERAFARGADATVVRAETKRAPGVAEGQKWVLVRIREGTLVAYEDLRPVFATLVSPGAGGVARRGASIEELVKASTTPRGTYYITSKIRATTMSPDKGEDKTFWIADVPHTQFFHGPFALHAAYWHERFGDWVSAGCVNLSPRDAEALFAWTDPPVPEGWQAAAGYPENGPKTAVVVRP